MRLGYLNLNVKIISSKTVLRSLSDFKWENGFNEIAKLGGKPT